MSLELFETNKDQEIFIFYESVRKRGPLKYPIPGVRLRYLRVGLPSDDVG